MIADHPVQQEDIWLPQLYIHKYIKSVSNLIACGKSRRIYISFFFFLVHLPGGSRVSRADKIIKSTVIDGILMEEDRSISNISRFLIPGNTHKIHFFSSPNFAMSPSVHQSFFLFFLPPTHLPTLPLGQKEINPSKSRHSFIAHPSFSARLSSSPLISILMSVY